MLAPGCWLQSSGPASSGPRPAVPNPQRVGKRRWEFGKRWDLGSLLFRQQHPTLPHPSDPLMSGKWQLAGPQARSWMTLLLWALLLTLFLSPQDKEVSIGNHYVHKRCGPGSRHSPAPCVISLPCPHWLCESCAPIPQVGKRRLGSAQDHRASKQKMGPDIPQVCLILEARTHWPAPSRGLLVDLSPFWFFFLSRPRVLSCPLCSTMSLFYV